MALQAELCARHEGIHLPEKAPELHRELQRLLLSACDDDILDMKPGEIFATLKLTDSPLGNQPVITP
jgi:hypothetical protein